MMVSLWAFHASVLQAQSPSGEPNLSSTLDDLARMSDTDKNLLLSTVGAETGGGFTWAKIVAWLLFGGIGFVAFMYGKSNRFFKPLIIGLVLMVYPYFISHTFWLYAIGIGLCVALYFWRD